MNSSSSSSSSSPSPSSCSNSHHPPPPSLLSSLAIFKNILNQELIRSVHVYRAAGDEEGKRETWVEREFLFSPTSYLEIRAPIPHPLLLLDPTAAVRRRRPRFQDGEMVGLWLCIFAFDSSATPSSSHPIPSIPSILSFSRNPRLKSIPTLASDLQKVFQLMFRTENEEPVHFASEETSAEKEDESTLSREHLSTIYEDQLSHSCPVMEQLISKNPPNDQLVPEVGVSLKKRRAAAEHVASIALTDLAKYFNLPITEASRNLKVGLTVLKRKCREFGIPRWPHRKIKSLDTLIHSLQEEVTQQQKENKAAAVKAAARRQRMLESEKESIERRPFMELQGETKRFRQDVFKRRHKAKALSEMHQLSFPQDHNCAGR